MAERITRYIERYDTPRERLLGVFGAQGELFAEGTYRGCAFARASAESHPGDLVEQATEGYRAWVRSLLTRLAEEAGVPDAPGLARQLHLLYDGSGLSARMDHDPTSAAAARTAAAALLEGGGQPVVVGHLSRSLGAVVAAAGAALGRAARHAEVPAEASR